MTKEAQRIAIAKACGWTNLRYAGMIHPKPLWGTPPWDKTDDCHPPDYLNDLNAMHEAEKYLRPGQYVEYIGLLCKNTADKNDAVLTSVALFHATAAQRAEAILKTLNLWIEEKVEV